jgi:oligopeptidase B
MSVATPNPLTPPIAKRVPHRLEAHGDVRTDDYYWLRDRDDPHTIPYLQAENDYLKATLAPTEPLQETLFQEFKSRIKETDLSVPERIGPYLYYVRTEEGKPYAIYCRRLAAEGSPEEILLDGNVEAEGKPYWKLYDYEPSPDHTMLAFGVDDTGAEEMTIRVKVLATGALLPDLIERAAGGLEWSNDNRTLFYINQDEVKRPHQLKRHDLGSDSTADPVIYEETDETFHLALWKTRSHEFFILQCESTMSSEVRFKPAHTGDGTWTVFEPRRPDTLYYIADHGGNFYFRTNENGQKNFALLRCSITAVGRQHCETIIPHSREVAIEDIDCFRDHLVITKRDRGLLKLEVWNELSKSRHSIEFQDAAYTVETASNPEYDTATLRFVYTSLATPHSVYDYNMDTRERTLMKQEEVLGGYDPATIAVERLHATAADGTLVPLSVVYRKGLALDGGSAQRMRGAEQNQGAPCLLYGYGSYGIPMDPEFSTFRLSLLDRGFVYAIAHIRGGGDVGRFWYENGKKLTKRNTFTDFIACAEHLIARGYTSPAKLTAMGGSAGGMLMGGIANLRPDLFKAIIAKVPFVDCVTTMLDPTIPLTTQEYDEWGNPEDKTYYQYMKAYSPYDNVTPVKYPDLLITTGINDPRVA